MSIAERAKLDVRPQSGWTGAEIHGVDISQPLDAQTVAQIRQTLLQWKVIFFRDQHLDHAAHIRFGKYFGDITQEDHYESDVAPKGFPEIHTVSSLATNRHYTKEYHKPEWRNPDGPDWHADATALVSPPAFSILRAESVPPFSGDTHFTNVAAAYQGLSEPMQKFIKGLRAEHRFGRSNDAAAIHPVVRIHPETGEPVIYVNPGFTVRIRDLSPRESRHLLDLLFEQVQKPQFTTRFRWDNGSVAFWDNRAALHLAPTDFEHLGFDRILYRITVAGDTPIGPDGRKSEGI